MGPETPGGNGGEREPSPDLDTIAHAVIGAAIEVHREIGPGYHESIYEEALCVELTLRGIPFERQVGFKVEYKGHRVGKGRLDVLVAGKLILEFKAVETLLPKHKAQVLSYLKATKKHLGLLMNFNESILKDGVKRIILS